MVIFNRMHFFTPAAFFLFLGILTLSLGTIRAANTLHSFLLKSIIHLPMRFFDTNPSGRIMNRFGKEINKVDKNLPMVVRSFVVTLLRVRLKIALYIKPVVRACIHKTF